MTITFFEEELPVGCCRQNDNVASPFRFGFPGSVDFILYHLERLSSADKSEHARICSRGIVRLRKNHAVLHLHAGHYGALVEDFSVGADRK